MQVIDLKEIQEEKKWRAVKRHYEQAYAMTFKSRPAPEMVNNLFKKMNQLRDDYLYYKNQSSRLEKIIDKIPPA